MILYGKVKPVISSIFLFCLFILAMFLLDGCTISVTTLHTQGTASDVVDENATVSPNVDAKAEIPSVVPKI